MMPGALRALARRGGRTTAAIAGVAIGFAAWISLVSAADDLPRRFGARVAATGAEMAVRQAGVGMAILSRVKAADVPRIREAAGARWASGVLVQLTRRRDGSQLPVFGVDLESPLASIFTLEEGRRLVPGSREVLVGRSAAESLGRSAGSELEILPGDARRVRGVFASHNAFVDGGCALELGEAQRLFGMEGLVSLVLVKLDDPARLREAIGLVKGQQPHLHATASELYFAGFHELDAVASYARSLGLAALVVAVLVVASILARNVAERRQELAVLRAVGWSRTRVAGTVLAEGALLATLGGAVGLAGAWLFLRAASVAGLSPWLAPAIPPRLVAEGVFLLALGVGLGCVPALVTCWATPPSAALR